MIIISIILNIILFCEGALLQAEHSPKFELVEHSANVDESICWHRSSLQFQIESNLVNWNALDQKSPDDQSKVAKFLLDASGNLQCLFDENAEMNSHAVVTNEQIKKMKQMADGEAFLDTVHNSLLLLIVGIITILLAMNAKNVWHFFAPAIVVKSTKKKLKNSPKASIGTKSKMDAVITYLNEELEQKETVLHQLPLPVKEQIIEKAEDFQAKIDEIEHNEVESAPPKIIKGEDNTDDFIQILSVEQPKRKMRMRKTRFRDDEQTVDQKEVPPHNFSLELSTQNEFEKQQKRAESVPPKEKKPEVDLGTVVKLLESGLSQADIGRQLNVDNIYYLVTKCRRQGLITENRPITRKKQHNKK
ncbi:hypothetical protein niasHS_000071 [Heterodera schachtii]|uniref:Uncharacterized protein n=1 Tax=Heterodera schachtii TaxID=97005 RepID=A0ABD2KLU6_HETSC